MKTLNAYFSCVCKSSITEALYFARSQHPAAHRNLFELMLAFVHGSSSGDTRSKRGTELVSVPFSEEETSWFEEYLLRGKGKSLCAAKDTMIMRYMATGEGQKAEGLIKDVKERNIDGINWTTLTLRMSDV